MSRKASTKNSPFSWSIFFIAVVNICVWALCPGLHEARQFYLATSQTLGWARPQAVQQDQQALKEQLPSWWSQQRVLRDSFTELLLSLRNSIKDRSSRVLDLLSHSRHSAAQQRVTAFYFYSPSSALNSDSSSSESGASAAATTTATA